jgi:hypothetical protein
MVKTAAMIRAEEARAAAAAQHAKARQDDEVAWQAHMRQREVEAEKIAQLRDLRLKKEAADRAAATAAPKKGIRRKRTSH